jgi:putative FmdB family regulatory protein
MPLYEYQCDSCGHGFERIQKFSDPLETVCPVCGGAVQKLVSSPAFHLKGSGWYASDYGKTDKSSDKASDAAAEKASTDAKSGTESASKETSADKDRSAAKDKADAPSPAPTKPKAD